MPNKDTKAFPPYWAVPFATYADVTDFLRELETASILRGRPSDGTVSLAAVARCLHELKRPDLDYRSVHITGTNGKTTVSRMMAALIGSSGLRVGLYTSPHPSHFRERIAINGQPISEQELVDACNHVKAFLDWEGVQLTSFEFLTTAAFFAFRAAKVDYAVIEVGIGGRQDATNVIAPDVSVVTTVDYDHMNVLGHTLEHIAAEKAGIIKPFTPVVCGVMSEEARRVILSRAEEVRAPVLQIGRDYDMEDFERDGYQGRCSLRVGPQRWSNVAVNAPASFMATNAAHAVAAYDVLRSRGLVSALAEVELRTVLAHVELPACCEVLKGAPTVMLDSAHNAPAMARLAAIMRTTFDGQRLVLVVSLSREKECEKMVRHLADGGAERIIFTRYPSEGTVAPLVLADVWRSGSSAPAEVVEDPEAAFARAVHATGPHGVVVVTGSTQLGGLCRSMVASASESLGTAGPPVRPGTS